MSGKMVADEVKTALLDVLESMLKHIDYQHQAGNGSGEWTVRTEMWRDKLTEALVALARPEQVVDDAALVKRVVGLLRQQEHKRDGWGPLAWPDDQIAAALAAPGQPAPVVDDAAKWRALHALRDVLKHELGTARLEAAGENATIWMQAVDAVLDALAAPGQQPCPECGGIRWVDGEWPDGGNYGEVRCPECKGTGKAPEQGGQKE